MRRLRAARRQIPLDRADDYMLAWEATAAAVQAAGGRAWIFRGAGHEDRFLEFIEWTEPGESPLDDEAVDAAVARLDLFGAAARVDDWEEAT